MKPYVCCICKEDKVGYGNNPNPVEEKGKCCDKCNIEIVIPKRIEELDSLLNRNNMKH
jgi:hypothetical protein